MAARALVPWALLILAAQMLALQPPAPQFELRTADGRSVTGALEAIEKDGTVVLDAKPGRFGPREWLSLRREKTRLPPLPATPLVLFANGDRVPLATEPGLKIAGNRLKFRPGTPLKAAAGSLEAHVATVAVIWLGAPDGVADVAGTLRQLQMKRPTADVVLLRDGSRVEGTLAALDDAKGCKVQAGKRSVEIAWADVAAVAFNGELSTPGLPEGPFIHAVLAGGARVSLTALRAEIDKGLVRGKTLAGGEVEVALADVIAFQVRQGAAMFLSDLKPLRYEHTPFAGTSWPLVADGCATGHELRLDGSIFDKGLGMHAESRVSYALGGKYRWFEARVGLDPEQGKKGRVRLRALADGKEIDLGWNKELTARDEPLTLRLDVRGARELTLEVLFGSYGDVQANINWAEARLIE